MQVGKILFVEIWQLEVTNLLRIYPVPINANPIQTKKAYSYEDETSKVAKRGRKRKKEKNEEEKFLFSISKFFIGTLF